jgi:hypothetical protein
LDLANSNLIYFERIFVLKFSYEVTTESWFGRIGGAFKGIVVGLVLFFAAFPHLFWNEGRTVKRYKTLHEGAGSVISLFKLNKRDAALKDFRSAAKLGHEKTKAILNQVKNPNAASQDEGKPGINHVKTDLHRMPDNPTHQVRTSIRTCLH